MAMTKHAVIRVPVTIKIDSHHEGEFEKFLKELSAKVAAGSASGFCAHLCKVAWQYGQEAAAEEILAKWLREIIREELLEASTDDIRLKVAPVGVRWVK